MTDRAVFAAPARLFDSGSLRFFPAALREPRRPALAIALGWALTFFPSLLLSWLSQALFPALAKPEFAVGGATALFLLVIFSPAIETLIMGAILSLLLRVLPPTAAVIVSAVGWGIAHSIAAPVWGLTIWWPFLIFSTLFVVWKQRGWLPAATLVASVHALHNLLPALALVAHR